MIEKIDSSQIPDILEKSSLKQFNSTGAIPNSQDDASLQVDYAAFLDTATPSPQTDAQAIQRAQELLASGQLENPQNVREAAENIAEFGI
jgi:hypothetical protein